MLFLKEFIVAQSQQEFRQVIIKIQRLSNGGFLSAVDVRSKMLLNYWPRLGLFKEPSLSDLPSTFWVHWIWSKRILQLWLATTH